MRLNSAADAETMANIIGTKASVETTHKSAGILLDADGAGTKKVVREYKVSPDTIKELPPLHAILYDKQEPANIKMLKVPFVKFWRRENKVSLRDGAAHIITSQGRVVFFILKNLHAFPLDL